MNIVRKNILFFFSSFLTLFPPLHSPLADNLKLFFREDDAIQKHERIVALPCPNNDQRQLVSEYIWNDDLNGGRGAFLSPELRGKNPEVYREEWLEDLVVFEHGAESMDAFARWVTQPLLEAAHFCCLGRNKVRLIRAMGARYPSLFMWLPHPLNLEEGRFEQVLISQEQSDLSMS